MILPKEVFLILFVMGGLLFFLFTLIVIFYKMLSYSSLKKNKDRFFDTGKEDSNLIKKLDMNSKEYKRLKKIDKYQRLAYISFFSPLALVLLDLIIYKVYSWIKSLF